MQRGTFREDLYYRLNVFEIRLPPLRDRRDDIVPLSEAFLAEIGRSIWPSARRASRATPKRRCMDYHWPGNVRELRNVLERAAILCDGGLIAAEHLALTHGVLRAATAAASADSSRRPAPCPFRQLERSRTPCGLRAGKRPEVGGARDDREGAGRRAASTSRAPPRRSV